MSDEPFLSRWSRLKRTGTKPEPAVVDKSGVVAEEGNPLPTPDAALPVTPTAADASAADPAPADDPLKDLPPIEELTGESDFTPFLRAEVPEDLHRQALRKLWTSDPVYANDDGLKDYADDYTGLFSGNDPVKTLYRVGRGFLADDETATADDAAPPAGSPSPPRGEGRGEGDAPPDLPASADALPPPAETPLAAPAPAASSPHPAPSSDGTKVV